MKNKDYDAKNVVKDYEKAIFQNVICIGLSINTLIPNVYDKFCKWNVRVSPQSNLTALVEHESSFTTVS